jgi:DNA-directed RNA polymerase sigma subunit (sigma70/sigma32)
MAANELAHPSGSRSTPLEIAAQEEIFSLPSDEAEVLRLRFGLSQPRLAIREIAAKRDSTIREVEQVEARALQRLRWRSLIRER